MGVLVAGEALVDVITGQDGTTRTIAGGGPYTMPLQITDASQIGSVRLTISYNPAVLKAQTVTQGSFMTNGGVTTVFTPRIDEAGGKIERSKDPLRPPLPEAFVRQGGRILRGEAREVLQMQRGRPGAFAIVGLVL